MMDQYEPVDIKDIYINFNGILVIKTGATYFGCNMTGTIVQMFNRRAGTIELQLYDTGDFDHDRTTLNATELDIRDGSGRHANWPTKKVIVSILRVIAKKYPDGFVD